MPDNQDIAARYQQLRQRLSSEYLDQMLQSRQAQIKSLTSAEKQDERERLKLFTASGISNTMYANGSKLLICGQHIRGTTNICLLDFDANKMLVNKLRTSHARSILNALAEREDLTVEFVPIGRVCLDDSHRVSYWRLNNQPEIDDSELLNSVDLADSEEEAAGTIGDSYVYFDLESSSRRMWSTPF